MILPMQLQIHGGNPLDHTLLASTRMNRALHVRQTVLQKNPTRIHCIKLHKPASMALTEIARDFAAKTTPVATTAAVGVLSVLLILVFFFRGRSSSNQRKSSSKLPTLLAVPGLPIIGNLLQLKEKKPHKTFARWAETYGPIYSIKTGATTVVVLNSSETAKEAMVAQYSSICTRNLPTALQILTANKCMVAMSDYNGFHKTVKRHILTSVLGPAAQRRFSCHRGTLVEDVVAKLHQQVHLSPFEAVHFREVFENELFGLSLKEAVGEEVQSLYVEELGKTYSKKEIFKVLVTDFMVGAVEVDWRDFFPYLKWVPNKTWENKIHQIASRRNLLMKALIRQQKKCIFSPVSSSSPRYLLPRSHNFYNVEQQEVSCYLGYLLSEETTLTEDQIAVLVWEAIIEAADTTLVTTEWALYELSKDPSRQERLYQDIQKVCGSERITEDQVSKIPFLGAVFHETLRKHSPVPIIPMRYVHEDTQLGGYFIPKGTEIAINIYGCNRDKKQWENPDTWSPERFLDDKYEPADLYKTMAFGAGKRVCAGSLQASLISCISIGRLVQEFEWSLRGDEEDDVDTMGLTGYKLRPLQAVLKPRTHP